MKLRLTAHHLDCCLLSASTSAPTLLVGNKPQAINDTLQPIVADVVVAPWWVGAQSKLLTELHAFPVLGHTTMSLVKVQASLLA